MLDGIVFSGGIDIDPSRYGADRHPATDPAQAHRDAGELRLLEAALERDLPTLAICRGFQLLNVLRGGDLVQHLPEEVGHEGHRETLGVFSRAPRRREGGHAARGDPRPAPRLGALEPPPGRRPGGEGLVESAYAEDGSLEAIEDPVEAVRRSACSGTPRWRRTTSACSRRSSTRRGDTAPTPIVDERRQSVDHCVRITLN